MVCYYFVAYHYRICYNLVAKEMRIMLYKEILTQALSSTILKDENLQAIAAQLIHDTCCQAVLEIQAILADDTRTDKDCFYQIEKIVCALQDKGISCGNRHDFG